MVVRPEDVTAFLHAEIPLTQAMALAVTAWDGRELRLAAPLPPNSNHEDTAFGGAIANLGIVAGWTFLHLKLQEAGLDGRLVIARSEVMYLKPVAGDLLGICRDGEEWPKFLRSVQQRGRGRIRMRTEIGDATGTGAVHEGVYVVQAANGAPTPA